MAKYVDDQLEHLEDDRLKMRKRFRQYVSFSGTLAAKAIVLEAIYNCLDECKNPRSPGNQITIDYDERHDIIHIEDNGRGIPSDKLEMIFTTLNSGSNLSDDKSSLNVNVLGRNGVGTLAITSLSEVAEVITNRGGTENISKRILFNESEKVEEECRACEPSKHGLSLRFKPSKCLGRNTRIIWEDIRSELVNLQFLNKKKIKIKSSYINKDDELVQEDYKTQPFVNILTFRNNKESLIGEKIYLLLVDNNIQEEVGGINYKRFIDMDIAFTYTNSMTPYIDSFSNGTNTIENGSHLDGVLEGMCRYFQRVLKDFITERDKLDIKWEDVKTGLSLVVSLNTDFENLYTNQSKHRIYQEDLEKLIKEKTIETLDEYFKSNQAHLKELANIIKTNAKARREGEKARTAIIKESMNTWGAYSIKGFEPCVRRGAKEYKEIFICEGLSAKGSLKLARDPKFQAIYAVRGVSANVYKLDLNGVLANEEFRNLIKVLGCNVGSKFDLSKLQYNKIIIATDADQDGLGIRSLLCSFFFKIFPEIIEDNRLFIAEPPLYRVDDKKDPLVINKKDYIQRYIKRVMKEYHISINCDRLDNKKELEEFLSVTNSYMEEIQMLAQHYKINEELMEMILDEIAKDRPEIDMSRLMATINDTFPEIFYDERDQLIKGVIDGKYQSIEITERLIRKSTSITSIMRKYDLYLHSIMLRNKKDDKDGVVSSLLIALRQLAKFKPRIVTHHKGLGENSPEDLKLSMTDPNTRVLIRVRIGDIENDKRIFQTLRGTSPFDAQNRKRMMKEYQLNRLGESNL